MKLRFRFKVSLLDATESEILPNSSFVVDSRRPSELCVRDVRGVESITRSALWLLSGPEGSKSLQLFCSLVDSKSPSTLCVRNGGATFCRRVLPLGLVGGRQAVVNGLEDLRRLKTDS